MTQDAVAPMAAHLHRHHKKMRFIVAALGLVFVVTAALLLSRVIRLERAVAAAHPGETSAPAPPQPLPAQAPPSQAIPRDTSTAQPQQPVAVPGGNNPDANNPEPHPSTGNIDLQSVQGALNTLASHTGRPDSSQPKSASSADSSGSDRYPGSRPVEVNNANLPDIGIPVASEVTATSDSVATVVGFYRERYPDAEVSEMNGQKIVAVNQPGATKVIAIGSNGSETRIAIVQPAN